jgi:membrane protease YdiL (CAAX protease family)
VTRPARATPSELRSALLSMFVVWSAVVAAGLLVHSGLAASRVIFGSFLALTMLALATRPTSRFRRRGGVLLFGLGLAAGFASYPAWMPLVATAGMALDLGPRGPLPPGAGSPLVWAATVGLAPVFEELVYRERLLPALDRRLGGPPALLLTSLLFALPHLEPWAVLTTFLLGLVLGGLMKLSGAVSLCIGLHAGLNLAACACGVPPVRFALPIPVSAASCVVLLVAAVGLARVPRRRRPLGSDASGPASNADSPSRSALAGGRADR